MFRKKTTNHTKPFLGAPAPQNSFHSYAYSPDLFEYPSRELITLSTQAISIAADLDFGWAKDLNAWDPHLDISPGEHYRLLAGLIEASGASKILEIGTYKGLGSIALWAGRNDRCVTTYDILPLEELGSIIPNSALNNGSIISKQGDLSDQQIFEDSRGQLSEMDFIFLDGPKNGRFEYEFLDLLSTIHFEKKCLLVIDDIRFLNMIPLWRSILNSKQDLTSFGHWSGTGIVLIDGRLELLKQDQSSNK